MIQHADKILCLFNLKTVWWCMICKTKLSLKMKLWLTRERLKYWKLTGMASSGTTIPMNSPNKIRKMSSSWAIL